MKNRNETCIGGFQFVDAPISHQPLVEYNFNSLVNTVVNRRRNNPRFGMATDPVIVAAEVDYQNAVRMQSIRGGNHYIHNLGNPAVVEKNIVFDPIPEQDGKTFMSRVWALLGEQDTKERFKKPRFAACYILPIHEPNAFIKAARFANSWGSFPPGIEIGLYIVCNGGELTTAQKNIFYGLPVLGYIIHDDSGWDIGGYIAAAEQIDCEMIICFGGNSYFKKTGWGYRFAMAVNRFGPGMYGSLATYFVSPHLNTTGFCVPPEFLRWYPRKVTERKHRYDFEHGGNALWKFLHVAGAPVKLVTWNGEYDWQDWRKPGNVYRRGDQSNCLTYFNHSELWEGYTGKFREEQSALADTITDPVFKEGGTFQRIKR